MTEKPNAELAYKVLDYIATHPANWRQGVWLSRDAECGTSGCFAGWAVMLTGHKPVFDESSHFTPLVLSDGIQVAVPDLAEELLGARFTSAPWGEEEDLFESSNDFNTLRRLVHEIFGPRPADVR